MIKKSMRQSKENRLNSKENSPEDFDPELVWFLVIKIERLSKKIMYLIILYT